MKIQQFAEQMKQENHPAPLLEALQAMRTFNLSTLRGLMEQSQLNGWPEWPPSVDPRRAELSL